MDDLLPCPFCGEATMLLSDTYDNAGSAFECQNCLARGPEADTLSNVHPYSRRDASEIEADARRLWNLRAKPTL
jgi:Lar family restriction alleviation protein